MPVRKNDPSVAIRHFTDCLVLGVPFVLAIAAVIYGARQGRGDLSLAGMVLGIVLGIVGLIRQQRRFRRYDCPQCGARLPKSRGKKSIEFFCPDCDIIWDSGFVHSSDDAGGD
jgi:hypothetical protein